MYYLLVQYISLHETNIASNYTHYKLIQRKVIESFIAGSLCIVIVIVISNLFIYYIYLMFRMLICLVCTYNIAAFITDYHTIHRDIRIKYRYIFILCIHSFYLSIDRSQSFLSARFGWMLLL